MNALLKEPMLAGKFDSKYVGQELFGIVQPKIDGLRMVLINGVPYSRSMKKHPNKALQAFAAWMQKYMLDHWGVERLLDGEIMVTPPEHSYRAPFTETLGIRAEDATGDFTFYVFDYAINHVCMEDRLTHLRLLLNKEIIYVGYPGTTIRVKLLHSVTTSFDNIFNYEQLFLQQGAEGLIYRSPYAFYKQGRATSKSCALLKLKRWDEDEATITGVEPLMRNFNEPTINEVGRQSRSSHKDGKVADELLGALICDWRGKRLSIGSGPGLTMNMREQLWAERDHLIGQKVTFKYFAEGDYEVPRHPLFKAIRPSFDVS